MNEEDPKFLAAILPALTQGNGVVGKNFRLKGDSQLRIAEWVGLERKKRFFQQSKLLKRVQ